MNNPYEKIQQKIDAAKPDHAEWIRTCEIEHFPPIVMSEIEKKLIVSSRNDIPRVLETLYRLRKDGTSALWDEIDVEVEILAKRQCGSIFPRESIAAGRNLLLNFEYLACFTANQIAKIDNDKAFVQEFELALSINHQYDESAFEIYLKNHPATKTTRLSREERTERCKQALGPSLSDNLEELSKSIERLISGSMTFFNHAMNAGNRFAEASSLREPSFFRDNPGRQGCEPPPGSRYDDEGRVNIPGK